MVPQVAAVKTIIKRPWVHHLIVWGYILAPAVNIILVSLFLHVPLLTIVQRLFRGYGALGTIWLLTAPLVGISLYFVSRTTWYIFLAHSALVFFDFVIKSVARPLIMSRIPPLNNLLIIAGNLALVVLIGYIIQRDFRAPYFQALQRSFREHRRVPIRHRIVLNGLPAHIDDLSITGCFVPGPLQASSGPMVLRVGQEVTISFRSETLTLTTRGQVMRVTPSGWGIRFLSLKGREKKDVARLLKNRYALRYKADLPAEWSLDHSVHTARLVDVSATGCFLASEVPALAPGVSAAVAVNVDVTDLVARGHVVWVNPQAEHDKPQGFGFRFNRRQRRLIRLVRMHLGKLEQTR